MATYLQNWQQAQAARLKHLQFQVTSEQLLVVEQALGMIASKAEAIDGSNPNFRGNALYALCRNHVDREEKHHD